SNAEEFDFASLVLESPRFTFFHAQEFFLSREAACTRPVDDIEPQLVPVNTNAKRAQLQQRFVVKHITESLATLVKLDASKARDIKKTFFSKMGPQERVPPVELHLFSEDPQQVNSTWKALLIPRARKIFGQTFYLCRGEGTAQLLAEPRCVAKLSFEPLPLRLMHVMGMWSPSTDRLRSIPHKLEAFMEALLLASAAFVAFQVVDSLCRLLTLAWEQYHLPPEDEHCQKLREHQLPKAFVLTQHSYVYKLAGERELLQAEPLDACRKVRVMEMAEASREWRGLADELVHRVIHRTETSLWGRLQSPDGWIVLSNSAQDVRVLDDEEDLPAPFCANTALLVPFTSLLRRQLILATGHASAQWFLLDRFSQMFAIANIMAISISLFVIHVVVLWQTEILNACALRYEQVLKSQNKLLPLRQRKEVLPLLAVASLVLLLALTSGILSSTTKQHKSAANATLPCTTLFATVALHLLDLYSSVSGLQAWRASQLSATEFTRVSSEGLETTDTNAEVPALSRARRFRKQLVRLLTSLVAVGALNILMLIVLDGLQMRGELVDYSFNRGYTAIPPHSQALHNTLLLHKDVDAVSFAYETGPFTSQVKLRLEHPLLDIKEATVFDSEAADSTERKGGEYTVSMPAGPLYSRLVVEASSHLHHQPTKYVVHLLRIGEAVSLSIDGPMNPAHFAGAKIASVTFNETRRWQYQLNNPVWYVPDLDVTANSSFQLSYLPIIFAPLIGHHEREAGDFVGLSTFSRVCRCGREEPGFGNACAMEEVITLPGGDELCVFQRGVKQQLVVEESDGSMSSNAVRLVQWLVDVDLSGKYAGLRLADTDKQLGFVMSLKKTTARSEDQASTTVRPQLASVFRASVSTELLLAQATQVVFAPTQDMTDAEALSAPLKIVSHTPPIHLSMESANGSRGFFLPEPNAADDRTDFAVCLVGDLAGVKGRVANNDSRFEVAVMEVSKGHSCDEQATVKRKQFKTVRKHDPSCDPYCPFYRPWADTYDISATLSAPYCFDQAINVDDISAFRNISSWVEEPGRRHIFEACGTLQRALEVKRTSLASEMLSSLGANPDGGVDVSETPLQALAARGDIESMRFLLRHNASVNHSSSDGSTPLFAAAQNCHVRAVQLLLNEKADPNHLMAPFKGSRCHVTPLLSLFSKGTRSKDCGGDRLNVVVRALVEGGAKLSVAQKTCGRCQMQTVLIAALENDDVPAVRELFRLGAKDIANAAGCMNGHPMTPFASIFALFDSQPALFKELAGLLKDNHADVDASVRIPVAFLGLHTPLMEAADKCRADLIAVLVALNADPAKLDDESRTAEGHAESSNCSNLQEIRKLLRNSSRGG
ncbi:Asb3, partial [Symbiodinium necroappetens]